MKRLSIWQLFALLPLLVTGLTGCELVGDIFRAGMWVGVILVIVIIGVVLWILRKIF